MTKKLVLFIIVLLGFSIESLMAQSISGKVVDEKNIPLPYVGVVLQNFQDSLVVFRSPKQPKLFRNNQI